MHAQCTLHIERWTLSKFAHYISDATKLVFSWIVESSSQDSDGSTECEHAHIQSNSMRKRSRVCGDWAWVEGGVEELTRTRVRGVEWDALRCRWYYVKSHTQHWVWGTHWLACTMHAMSDNDGRWERKLVFSFSDEFLPASAQDGSFWFFGFLASWPPSSMSSSAMKRCDDARQ